MISWYQYCNNNTYMLTIFVSITLKCSSFPVRSHMSVGLGINGYSFTHKTDKNSEKMFSRIPQFYERHIQSCWAAVICVFLSTSMIKNWNQKLKYNNCNKIKDNHNFVPLYPSLSFHRSWYIYIYIHIYVCVFVYVCIYIHICLTLYVYWYCFYMCAYF